MASPLGRITRLTFLMMVGLVVTAVLLGRGASRPSKTATQSAPRWSARPRYHAFSGYLFPENQPHLTRLLDTETGEMTLLEVEDECFDLVTCSPWQDGPGQFHLAGRRIAPRGNDADGLSGALGIARCTYPDGRMLNRIAFELVPGGAPCWYPDRSDRILFAGCDGRLHELSLPGTEGPGDGATAIEPRPIRWKTRPPGKGAIHLQDPFWPGGGALGDRLLVALRFQRSSVRIYSRLQLWWLQLSPDGTAITAAGRLIVPSDDGPAGARGDERLPIVGISHEDVPMLAYMVLHQGEPPGELWIAPISSGASGGDGAPRVQAKDARRLTKACVTTAPAFSADGRWIYAATRSPRDGLVRVERFATAPAESFAGPPEPQAHALDSAGTRGPSAPLAGG
jgi:hypothetical protein